MDNEPELEIDSIKKRKVRRTKGQRYAEEVTKAMEKLWNKPDPRVVKAIKDTSTSKKISKVVKKRRKRS